MPPVRPAFNLPKSWFCGALLGVSLLAASTAEAGGCAPNPSLSACFDANSLWLPSGKASFISMPETGVTGVGLVTFAASSEWLHRPVVAHVSSPDAGGRDVHLVDSALDVSFYLSFGLAKALELNIAAPLRLYQTGAGASGVASQSAAPLERNAVRNPRLAVGYSMDEALALAGVGLRLGLEASLPLAAEQEFSAERAVVLMPSATFALGTGALRVQAELGARLRRGLDFGSVHLGNQGFAALGAGVHLLDSGRLFVTLEAFALPPLSRSRATPGNAQVTAETYLPAEWLLSVSSCFRKNGSWSLAVGAGSGLPLSSETRESSGGPSTLRFLGLGTPDFRSLLVLRFAPPQQSVSAH